MVIFHSYVSLPEGSSPVSGLTLYLSHANQPVGLMARLCSKPRRSVLHRTTFLSCRAWKGENDRKTIRTYAKFLINGMFNGNIIYKWGTSHCHSWLPKGTSTVWILQCCVQDSTTSWTKSINKELLRKLFFSVTHWTSLNAFLKDSKLEAGCPAAFIESSAHQ